MISEVEDDNSTNIICDELGSKPKNFGFAGLMVDYISGNYLSATRMYDENLGRFLGKDKIKGDIRYGFTQNEYTYCYNSPLIFVDSTGESPEANALTYKDFEGYALDYMEYTISPGGYALKELAIEGIRDFVKFVPRGAIDLYMNSTYKLSTNKIFHTDMIKNMGMKEYNAIKNLRKIAEVTGFSDLLNYLTVNGIRSDRLLNKFDFYKDDKGLIHAINSCWQKVWGYNKVYDFAFDAFTSMNRARFQFGSEKTTFTLWMWKGDYFNFGAGSEMGIYSGNNYHVDCYTQSHLKMYMNLTLKDGTVVSDWDAYDQWQWWITSFNPDKKFQDIKAEDLVMVGMVDFNEERSMWKEFVHTAEFDDHNVEKINDNWCLDLVHRNAVMTWKGGNKN